MSPTPWNGQKQVPNFAIGKQGGSLVDSSMVSRRSSGASDYERILANGEVNITSSNTNLMDDSSVVSRGSTRLVPISHPAVDVPLCMECQVKICVLIIYVKRCSCEVLIGLIYIHYIFASY